MPDKSAAESFAACVLALNLQTNVVQVPQPSSELEATCVARFGLVGAEAAVIGCPPAELRSAMQAAVSAAPELPHSPLGGPWAWDRPETRGSYMFNFGDMSEDKVDDWIALAGQLGINQIDFHGGRSFRFGDCYPNPVTYPNGRASFKAVIDKLHAAGIKAGLHTYAFFMDKACPWVTPVPDPRLAKDRILTLAQPLKADDTSIQVVESTLGMSAITGFFVRNSNTLQVGAELITYTGVSQEAPYVFSGCVRGAYGTQAASHAGGAQVGHLKECFGLFVPDGDTDMLAEVAAASADMYNACGFDMMYLDALDGEDILGGAEYSWHYGSKFVFELFKRLNKAPIMEMSTFHHHLWYVRSRVGAWDHPNRSHKRFIDLHCAENDRSSRIYLPGHLGWWAVKTWSGPLNEPTFSDDIEYLCGKAIGNAVGFSMMGIEPGTIHANPIYARLAGIIRQYEDLRRSDYFGAETKALLRTPGAEFHLEPAAAGGWQLVPSTYQRFKADLLPGQAHRQEVQNPYGRQVCGLRIETLMSAVPYNAPGAQTLLDLRTPGVTEQTSAPGVDLTLTAGDERLLASNHTDSPRGAWAVAGKLLGDIDLHDKMGLGVWVEGDGRGELLNVQLKSPEHLPGGYGEHYIDIDFNGWRYFTLIEPEGERWSNYVWPYGTQYTIYRENVFYEHVESIKLWLNNIPARGTAALRIQPVVALPLTAGKLVNPAITAGSNTLRLPVEIESGCYLEYFGADDCKLYGQKGELLADIRPEGDEPVLEPGTNELLVTSASAARARVTVITRGAALR
ncbi:MAG: hypothetical protein ACYC6L_00395, partial [Anaerolineae bacterium]